MQNNSIIFVVVEAAELELGKISLFLRKIPSGR